MVAVAKILAIILLGYALKRVGLFGADNYKVLQKMVLYVTLPAAIITSFATGRHDLGLLWISLFGLVCETIPLVTMFVVSRRMPVARRAFLMLNGSGFNVGNFTLPILQTFIGPAAALPAIMFDVGNSIMMSAGNYVTTAALLPLDETTRKAVVLICFAPAGIFSAIFTDKVLGNARLSGFCLTATGITGVAVMAIANTLLCRRRSGRRHANAAAGRYTGSGMRLI
ncbi:MAG: AEC family transporter [Bifidobacterium scardovii]|uniref:AEC family transporter n=1 Tax=Bifidobacterium scardovii TaxID=158787 RepID=UPI000666CBE9|nr:AEC family transporter [Bifidobacterium scardovii]MBS6947048.1 AEC family transporter [Bifidobacterium scardovii]MDU3736340.1 AEC family transporter [Bifidobacterium scardovii]MDU5296250.1 AEC family transporter [Bifidobacterium scardovii]MDU5610710.1 AEC family transporter [Bifidobacterium scardovii]MDU5885934.1 AEC family transporter [Bifidobacterium scardovii]